MDSQRTLPEPAEQVRADSDTRLDEPSDQSTHSSDGVDPARKTGEAKSKRANPQRVSSGGVTNLGEARPIAALTQG